MLALALLGCHPPAELDQVTITLDPEQPSVVHVAFRTKTSAEGFVRFGDDGELRHQSPVDAGGTRHEHELLGNAYGRRVTARPVARLEDGSEVEGDEVTIDVPPAPADAGVFTLVTTEPESEVVGGYVAMVYQVGEDEASPQYVAILDGRGEFVWLHAITPGNGTSSVAPSIDGTALVWPEYDELRLDSVGQILEMKLDGDLVSTTVAPSIHHAMAQLPGDRYAYLGREFLPATQEGASWFMTDTIRIVPKGDDGSHATTLFSMSADWLGEDLSGYWLPPCVNRYDQVFGYEQVCELTHSNSLAYLESADSLMVYPRWLDTLLEVDSESGALNWQLGGLYSDFTAPGGGEVYQSPDESYLWSQGHFSQVWDGGMALFDNGVNYDPPHSALAEYVWDEATHTVVEVWRYEDPDGGYTVSLGDARELPGGSVLGSWMTIGKVNEIARDGEVTWEVNTGAANVRRVFFLQDLYDLREPEL